MNQRITDLPSPGEMQIQIQNLTIFENPEDDKEITTANRFVRNKLCQTNTISICDRVTSSAEKGEVVKIIYLDFRKTSVTGSCDVLIRKLSKQRLDESSAKKFKSCTQESVINSSLLVWNNDSDGILWAPALGLIAVNIFITSLNNGMKHVIVMFAHKMKRAGNIVVERIKIDNVLDILEKWGKTMHFRKDTCTLKKLREKIRIAKKPRGMSSWRQVQKQKNWKAGLSFVTS